LVSVGLPGGKRVRVSLKKSARITIESIVWRRGCVCVFCAWGLAGGGKCERGEKGQKYKRRGKVERVDKKTHRTCVRHNERAVGEWWEGPSQQPRVWWRGTLVVVDKSVF